MSVPGPYDLGCPASVWNRLLQLLLFVTSSERYVLFVIVVRLPASLLNELLAHVHTTFKICRYIGYSDPCVIHFIVLILNGLCLAVNAIIALLLIWVFAYVEFREALYLFLSHCFIGFHSALFAIEKKETISSCFSCLITQFLLESAIFTECRVKCNFVISRAICVYVLR